MIPCTCLFFIVISIIQHKTTENTFWKCLWMESDVKWNREATEVKRKCTQIIKLYIYSETKETHVTQKQLIIRRSTGKSGRRGRWGNQHKGYKKCIKRWHEGDWNERLSWSAGKGNYENGKTPRTNTRIKKHISIWYRTRFGCMFPVSILFLTGLLLRLYISSHFSPYT